jgi:F-type H+-transporting ATPase subunit b
MPQFDFTTYSSQIFWFSICFAILYLAVYFIITPRVQEILDNRKKIIDGDLSSAGKINHEIDSLKAITQKNNQESNSIYHNKIESTIQKISHTRQEAIESLKKTIEENSKKSRKQLQELVFQSQKNSGKIIDEIAKNIKSKIIN